MLLNLPAPAIAAEIVRAAAEAVPAVVEAAADVVVVVATVVAAAVVVVTEVATAVVAEVATKSSLRKFSKAATKVAAFFYFVPQLIRHKSVIPNSCAEPAGERDLTKLVQHQQRCED